MNDRPLLDTEQLCATIRTVPDFPKPGIQFRDITTLLADPAALHSSVALLAEKARESSELTAAFIACCTAVDGDPAAGAAAARRAIKELDDVVAVAMTMRAELETLEGGK